MAFLTIGGRGERTAVRDVVVIVTKKQRRPNSKRNRVKLSVCRSDNITGMTLKHRH